MTNCDGRVDWKNLTSWASLICKGSEGMDLSKFRMTFIDTVEAICKRPKAYTLNGTFGEVLALLDGYAYGTKLRRL